MVSLARLASRHRGGDLPVLPAAGEPEERVNLGQPVVDLRPEQAQAVLVRGELHPQSPVLPLAVKRHPAPRGEHVSRF